jgi:hypothetical protein
MATLGPQFQPASMSRRFTKLLNTVDRGANSAVSAQRPAAVLPKHHVRHNDFEPLRQVRE